MQQVDTIVYVKDRTCQLDLLLRSIRDNFLNVGNVFVLYTYSNQEFKNGFDLIFNQSSKYKLQMIFVEQTNFKQNIIDILNQMSTPYFLGLCDDDVFIRQMDCSNELSILERDDVSSLSIKTGLDVHMSFPNIDMGFPQFIEQHPCLLWNWRLMRPDITWGYPTCVNSYIFMKDYFLWLIDQIEFHCPPYMEMGLNAIRKKFKTYMASLKQLKLLNIVANRLQTLSPNAYAKTHKYEVDDLNYKFLNGFQISTNNLYDSAVTMANEERELIFEKQ